MWLIKYIVQTVCSCLPGGVYLNYLLQVAKGSHRSEIAATRLIGLASVYSRLSKVQSIAGSQILEIGTGWDAINAVVLYLLGAKQVHTFDIMRHARAERVKSVFAQARNVIGELSKASGIPIETLEERISRVTGEDDVDAILASADIVYHAPADATCSGLPDRSIDLVVSYAVLAHLSVPLLSALVGETRRVLKRNGVAFHAIGMQDPYCNLDSGIGRVRFLKYPGWLWAIFNLNRFNYNNRLREQHYIELFSQHGAEVLDARSAPDETALNELRTLHIAQEFRNLSPQQLAVCFSELTIKFRENQ